MALEVGSSGAAWRVRNGVAGVVVALHVLLIQKNEFHVLVASCGLVFSLDLAAPMLCEHVLFEDGVGARRAP